MEYIYGLKYVFCLASCPVRQKKKQPEFPVTCRKKIGLVGFFIFLYFFYYFHVDVAHRWGIYSVEFY